jgi:hypothetical protein
LTEYLKASALRVGDWVTQPYWGKEGHEVTKIEGSRVWVRYMDREYDYNDTAKWIRVRHSTYLNGLGSELPKIAVDGSEPFTVGSPSDNQKEPPMDDNDRPRFMTAYITGDDDGFTPTGHAYKTLEAADAHAEEILRLNETEDQIAVFEIRSVHLARFTVTREAA